MTRTWFHWFYKIPTVPLTTLGCNFYTQQKLRKMSLAGFVTLANFGVAILLVRHYYRIILLCQGLLFMSLTEPCQGIFMFLCQHCAKINSKHLFVINKMFVEFYTEQRQGLVSLGVIKHQDSFLILVTFPYLQKHVFFCRCHMTSYRVSSPTRAWCLALNYLQLHNKCISRTKRRHSWQEH